MKIVAYLIAACGAVAVLSVAPKRAATSQEKIDLTSPTAGVSGREAEPDPATVAPGRAQPTAAPTATDSPSTDNSTADTSAQAHELLGAAAIQTGRAELGRALALGVPSRRRVALRKVEATLMESLGAVSDPNDEIELMALLARTQTADHDISAATQTVQQLHALVQALMEPAGFDAWLEQRVALCRRQQALNLATIHLREAMKLDPKSQLSAERDMLIGDILVQKSYPDRPYDAAIHHYARVAARYRGSHPTIANDARLRQARTLLKNDQVEDAMELYTELCGSEDLVLRETAEHYLTGAGYSIPPIYRLRSAGSAQPGNEEEKP